MGDVRQKLSTQSVLKSFLHYFIPTILGMVLMSVNIIVDGIFVGNGVGAVALASVNIAVPVFSIIISISILIGMGGATLYSMAMGKNNLEKARQIFSLSIVLLSIITIITTLVCYFNIDHVARIFGATEATFAYVIDYMSILLLSSLIFAMEVCLSIFIRNDGAPQLAMVGLIVTAVVNIILNYWMIFILQLEVVGAALATVIATAIGVFIYSIHFFRKSSNLKFVKIKWQWKDILTINTIGFPLFLSEAGMGILVMGYNIAFSYYIGTNGLAAFSVISYLHVFMLLAFIGIGSSIQPMISFYYGAKKPEMIRSTVKIAEIAGLLLGIAFIGVGYAGASNLIAIFGVTSTEIATMATNGLKLFFLAYLFMGINFTYMTYYQSIGQVKPSMAITVWRGFVFLPILLVLLPILFGSNGIWLALPVSEAIVAIFLLIYTRKDIMYGDIALRDF
ncbi:MATE family efflux transporter [Virgibacillus sp. W0430]|uniref:MATE family efflux transporter n=1 Tax=Virgibacillus sp. W0430 TaxID=3391580 RepID=UPI003F451FBE